MNRLIAFLLLLLMPVVGENSSAVDDPPQTTTDHEAIAMLLKQVREQHEQQSIVITRPKWPRDMPVSIEFDLAWYGTFSHSAGGRRIEFSDCQHRMLAYGNMPHPLHLSRRFSDGMYSVPLTCIDATGEVQIAVRMRERKIGASMSEFIPLSFSVELVDSVDDIMTSVIDEELTEHLSTGTSVRIRAARGTGNEKATLYVETPLDLPRHLTLAMKIELLDGDQVLATAHWTTTRWSRRLIEMRDEKGRETFFRIIETDIELAELIERAEGRALRARFSSDPELALRDFDSDKYWEGSFIIDIERHPWEPLE